MNEKIYCTLLGITLFFIRCKENEKRNQNSAASQKTGEIQFHLTPDITKAYKYEIINESSTMIETGEKDVENKSKIEIGLTYDIKRDTPDLYNYKMTYNRFKIYIKALDQEKEIDAEDAALSFDPMEKIYGAFKNAVIHIVTDKNAKVKCVSGFNELADRMKNLTNGNADALDIVNSSLEPYISEKNIKESFEKTFKLLPDRVLKEGDSWVVSQPVSNELKVNIENKYKVQSISKDKITIVVDADINFDNQPATVEGTTVTTTLKGDNTGEIIIERATGMLISSYNKLKLKGESSFSGRTLPIKLEMKNTVRRN